MNKTFSFEEHLDSEYEKRVWWWPFRWYVQPEALCIGGWEKNEEFFKKNYPVQFFIRRDFSIFFHTRVSMPLKEIKYNVKGYLRNPRKQMRDNLFPIRWQDLTETIVQFHIQTIIEFVDRENCFKYNDYSHTKRHKKFEKELKYWHNYVTVKRPALVESVDKAYENTPEGKPFSETYKDVMKIEKSMSKTDTKLCNWIVENREFFWV